MSDGPWLSAGPRRAGPRRIAHWLTLLILALNILASGLLPVRLDNRSMQMTGADIQIPAGPASSPQDGPPQSGPPQSGTMVGGAMAGMADCPEGKPAPGQPRGHTHDTCCIFCLPLMQGLTALPSVPGVPPPRQRAVAVNRVSPLKAPPPPAVRAAYPRGPPAALA